MRKPTTWLSHVSVSFCELLLMSLGMDDIKMAYECLSNPSKRAEYDDYLTSHTKMAGYQRRFNRDNDSHSESDSEEEEYSQKRNEDRAKRRFEEKDDFLNDQFFNSYYSRRRHGKQEFNENDGDNKDQQIFSEKGEDIKIEVNITFQEAVKGIIKGVMVDRKVR